MEDIESKQKGKYKTKLKFLEFVGGKGFVTFITNEAIISGTQLSGLELDGINFKLTIQDDSSVDLDEVDTSFTTDSQRGRLLEIIEEKTITSYRSRAVINELNFVSTKKFNDKIVPLLLSVEVDKPINKLFDTVNIDIPEASQNALDKLDILIQDLTSEETFTEISPKNSTIIQDSDSPNVESNIDNKEIIESSFEALKQQKLNELKSNLEKKRAELLKTEFHLKNFQIQFEDLKDDIKIIEDRIDNLQPVEDTLDYYFCVSESQNQEILIDDVTEKLIRSKVSKIKSINIDNFIKLFSEGEFHISLGILKDSGFVKIEDYKNLETLVVNKLKDIDIQISDDKISYQGDLTWGQLVNKMVKKGFQQDPIFNQLCGSNSYESNIKPNK